MKNPKRPEKERTYRLRLHRETLRRLEEGELRKIGGGATGRTCPIYSWCIC